MNGIVSVSKRKFVLVAFEVKPAVYKLVVVIAFETKRVVRFDVPPTFMFPETFALPAKRVVRFDVPFRFVVPETVRLVRVPMDTIFP